MLIATLMVCRLLPVDKHIARRAGEGGDHAIELARDMHLAAEARAVREAERHVEHVVLVVLRLREKIIVLRREDNVASRACDGALAGTLEINVMLMGDAEDVVALVDLDGLDEVALGIFKV